MPPILAVKLKLNKEILNKAPAAVPDFESEKEDTKITKSKLEGQSDQLKVPQKHGKGNGTSDYVSSRCTPYPQ